MDMYEECVPFGEPEVISGTWFSDFELNSFYEGARVSPEDRIPGSDPRTALVIEGTALDGLISKSREFFAVELSFIGRRELCDPIAPDYQIKVDKVEAAKIIRREPSHFYYPDHPRD